MLTRLQPQARFQRLGCGLSPPSFQPRLSSWKPQAGSPFLGRLSLNVGFTQQLPSLWQDAHLLGETAVLVLGMSCLIRPHPSHAKCCCQWGLGKGVQGDTRCVVSSNRGAALPACPSAFGQVPPWTGHCHLCLVAPHSVPPSPLLPNKQEQPCFAHLQA